MTLTAFLLARVAEDEEIARAVSTQRRWVEAGDVVWAMLPPGQERCDQHADPDRPNDCDDMRVAEGDDFVRNATPHIARHDPARVLAECEAKRRIVAEHGDLHGYTCGCYIRDPDEDDAPPCPTLRALAFPYATHPDYRQEWAL